MITLACTFSSLGNSPAVWDRHEPWLYNFTASHFSGSGKSSARSSYLGRGRESSLVLGSESYLAIYLVL